MSRAFSFLPAHEVRQALLLGAITARAKERARHMTAKIDQLEWVINGVLDGLALTTERYAAARSLVAQSFRHRASEAEATAGETEPDLALGPPMVLSSRWPTAKEGDHIGPRDATVTRRVVEDVLDELDVGPDQRERSYALLEERLAAVVDPQAPVPCPSCALTPSPIARPTGVRGRPPRARAPG